MKAEPPVFMALGLQNVREHSSPVAVDVLHMLKGASVLSCTEMTMTLQQTREASKRMRWLAQDGSSTVLPAAAGSKTGGGAATGCASVELGPLDIRTFVLRLRM